MVLWNHCYMTAAVSDILVNGYNSIYVERQGKLQRAPVRFKDNAHLLKIIEKIASGVGRRVDESCPMVDARLPDGSRVNAIISPSGPGWAGLIHPEIFQGSV